MQIERGACLGRDDCASSFTRALRRPLGPTAHFRPNVRHFGIPLQDQSHPAMLYAVECVSVVSRLLHGAWAHFRLT